MKKLLIAIAAAATTAIGAFAEGWTTGTPFSLESGNPGPLGSALVQELTVDPTVAASASGFWTGLTNTVEVKAFESGAPAPMDRFGSYAHLNYLSVKTAFGEPLFRNAQLNGAAYDMALDGNGNIYFEGNVKFTACDETPEIANDAKIALYLKDLSDVDTNPAAETNLYVNIGGVEYNCGNNIIEVDDWTKLTIKMLNIDGAGTIGFVIFLNGAATPLSPVEGTIAMPTGITLTNVAQSYADKNCLFPSATEGTTITGIGFAGQGELDQIAFTTEDLVPDPSIAALTFGNTIAKLYVSDGEKTLTFEGSPANFEYDTAKTYTYWYDAAPGYISLPSTAAKTLDFTSGGDITIDPADAIAAQVVIGVTTNDYATLALALADVKTATEDCTLILGTAITAVTAVQNTASKVVTIDLNGNNVSNVIGAQCPVVVVDSKGGAVVTAKINGTDVSIWGGTYDVALPAQAKLYDGRFKSGTGFYETAPTCADEGYKFVAGEGVDAGYWVKAVKPPFDGGEGTLEKPYLISSVKALQELQTKVAAGETFADTYFKQTAEIDLAGIAWAGIGVYGGENNRADDRLFSGIYDGNGKTIKNVTYAKKKYNGLFGNLGGAAQVKNLTITVAGIATEGTETSYGFGGAVGFAMGTDVLVENITVNPAVQDQASIQGTHNMGGIAARLEGKITLKNCVNNLDISTTYTKIAGMCAIASGRDAEGAIEFNGCVNNGTITAVNNGGNNGCAGILAYIQSDKQVSFIDCENNGTLTHFGETGADGVKYASILGQIESVTYGTISGNKAKADYLSVNNGAATDGLFFATVDNGVATFVKNEAVAAGNTNKVMAANGTATFELQAEGDYIAFDHALANATYDITSKTGVIETNDVDNVITFTAKAAGPVVPVDDDKELDDNGKAAAAKVAEVFGDDLTTWVTDVYGDGGKIPAAKLNATTDALIAAAKAFNLPIMTTNVEVTVAAAAEGFTFKIVDGEPINVQKANLQNLIKYAAALETGFGDSTGKVGLTLSEDNKSFNAKFNTPDAAAGFMKVDLTVEK